MKIASFNNGYYAVVNSKMFPIRHFSIENLMNRDWILNLEKELNENSEEFINVPEMLDPPIIPRKLMAVGRNYAEHALEAGHNLPKEPVFFFKAQSSIIGHNHPIIYPKIVTQLDYEVELAVIIGKRGKYISKEEALEYVAGYTIMNDVSARDHQYRYDQQWFVGKSFDTFAPLGPWIVDKFEIKNPQNINLKTMVNGEIRQNSNTSKMIFKIDYLINFISNVLTLEPGDIISTGTPSGVALGMKDPKYLKIGDVIEMEIENIGTLKNHIISE